MLASRRIIWCKNLDNIYEPGIYVLIPELTTYGSSDNRWVAISSDSLEIKTITTSDNGKRVEAILSVKGINEPNSNNQGLYKLFIINGDTSASHSIKYTISNTLPSTISGTVVSSNTTAPMSTNTTANSTSISDSIALTSFNESTRLDLSKDTAFNRGCIYASSTLNLDASENITLLLESDCAINTTWDGNYSGRKPTSEIWVSFIERLTSDSLTRITPAAVSYFNEGKAVKMSLTVNDTGSYKALILNHDPDQSHWVKYSLARGIASPPPEWIPSKMPLIALDRNPANPEIMELFITPDDPALKQTVQDILSTQISFNDFDALRDWVSAHISYKSDMDIHGVGDYWQLPAETLSLHIGDCEDYAILLCSLLRAYGVPADKVYVATGYASDGTGHAFLVEKWYMGVWRIIEPQEGAVFGWMIGDLLTASTYNVRYCFNDQNYTKGLPTLPPGVYEVQVPMSLYPMGRGAWVTFERVLNAGQKISATVEWISSLGGSSAIVNPWDIFVYDPNGKTVFSWSGMDLSHSFTYTPITPGVYKLEILKRDSLPRYVRLTIDPPDWG